MPWFSCFGKKADSKWIFIILGTIISLSIAGCFGLSASASVGVTTTTTYDRADDVNMELTYQLRNMQAIIDEYDQCKYFGRCEGDWSKAMETLCDKE